MTQIRADYLTAAGAAVSLIGDPAVPAAWEKPSALQNFRVSGLAGHLAHQVFIVLKVLDEAVPDQPPIGLLDHYARAAWLGADIDAEVNVGIRRGGEETATGGPEALAARLRDAMETLRERLPAKPTDRVVHLSWVSWSLTLDDFLTTRLMEIAVHSDDLAVSVGVATPALPGTAVEAVIDLLSRLAVRRHGYVGVMRALSRAERAPSAIAAF